MAGFPDEISNGGRPKADAATQHIDMCWEALPPFLRSYYLIKAYFYVMNPDARILLMVGIGLSALFVALIFHVPLFAAIAIGVLCALLGVFAIWLIERPKQ